MWGVIVSNDDDWTVALCNKLASGLVLSNNVLASDGRSKRTKNVITKVLEARKCTKADNKQNAKSNKCCIASACKNNANEEED